MIHIFQKKRFLVDYLSNFVDMHNHILPGIDDGAANPEESIGLLKGFGELGISRFIATPHIMTNLYPNTRATIQESFQELEKALLQEGIKDISIEAAAEHMIDNDFISNIRENKVLPIKESFLLFEMSYLQPPLNFEEAIISMASNGFFPILAHPERYHFIRPKTGRYARYKGQGILFQLNLLSLCDFYGKDVRIKAERLIDHGYIDFIASDVHNLNQLEALKKITLSTKRLSQLIPLINNTIDSFY